MFESPMNLCRAHEWNRIAFVGLSKHAGKTTALNHFVRQASAVGDTVGLLSIGLDGERNDSIMGVPKPSIYAPEGTLVVSAERALEASEARFEWIEELPISSPLGSAILARVTTPGNVVLAGLRQRIHMEMAIPKLESLGARYTLVDGAFDRIAAAAPHLVDAVVLAVGATAGRTEAEVIMAAQPFIAKFQLPLVSTAYRSLMEVAVQHGNIGVIQMTNGSEETHSLCQLPPNQALFGLTKSEQWSDTVTAVYIPGAVTDSVIEELSAHSKGLEVVAAHPAQVVLREKVWRDFSRRGHRLSVWKSVPIAGIAINPYHIEGHWFNSEILFRELAAIAGDVPLYDAAVEVQP